VCWAPIAGACASFSSLAVNEKVEPAPGVLSTPIEPPNNSTICREMARPNPVPP